MSDENQDKPNPSLERMLRGWGAGESIAKTSPPTFKGEGVSSTSEYHRHMPPPIPPEIAALAKKDSATDQSVESSCDDVADAKNKSSAKVVAIHNAGGGNFSRRFKYASAAVLLLAIGAGGMYLTQRYLTLTPPLENIVADSVSNVDSSATKSADPLYERVTELTQQVSTLRSEQIAIKMRYADLEAEKKAESARAADLASELAAINAKSTATSSPAADENERINALESDVVRLTGALKVAGNREEKANAELAAANKKLKLLEDQMKISADEATRNATRYAELAKELAMATKKMQEAEASLAVIDNSLSAAKVERVRIYNDMQKLYFATAGGEATGVSAAQKISKANKLIARAADMGEHIKDPAGIQLRDRIETMLTRLEMMNPGDPATVDAFLKSANDSKIIQQIDEMLAKGNDSAECRCWLLESKLVLIGAGCVA